MWPEPRGAGSTRSWKRQEWVLQNLPRGRGRANTLNGDIWHLELGEYLCRSKAPVCGHLLEQPQEIHAASMRVWERSYPRALASAASRVCWVSLPTPSSKWNSKKVGL